MYQWLDHLGYPTYGEWEHENAVDVAFVENNLRMAGRENEIVPDIEMPLPQKKPSFYSGKRDS
jgi:hypothetical protein